MITLAPRIRGLLAAAPSPRLASLRLLSSRSPPPPHRDGAADSPGSPPHPRPRRPALLSGVVRVTNVPPTATPRDVARLLDGFQVRECDVVPAYAAAASRPTAWFARARRPRAAAAMVNGRTLGAHDVHVTTVDGVACPREAASTFRPRAGGSGSAEPLAAAAAASGGRCVIVTPLHPGANERGVEGLFADYDLAPAREGRVRFFPVARHGAGPLASRLTSPVAGPGYGAVVVRLASREAAAAAAEGLDGREFLGWPLRVAVLE